MLSQEQNDREVLGYFIDDLLEDELGRLAEETEFSRSKFLLEQLQEQFIQPNEPFDASTLRFFTIQSRRICDEIEDHDSGIAAKLMKLMVPVMDLYMSRLDCV